MNEKTFQFKVVANQVERFRIESKAGRFTIVIDEPEEMGGSGAGPNPIEYLLASLAGCFIITTVYHAAERKVRIKSMQVEVTGKLDISGFTGASDVRPGLQEVIVNATVVSDEPVERVTELLNLAEEHCPVYDTLTKGTRITSRVEVKRS